jgi:peptidoglycan/LPS O-acetylase OafA/YrhL
MKKINAKMLLPLAAIAVAALFFAFAVFVGLRAVELATDARQNILLLALAVVAVASGARGSRGSRESRPARERRWSVASGRTRTRETSVLHPGL